MSPDLLIADLNFGYSLETSAVKHADLWLSVKHGQNNRTDRYAVEDGFVGVGDRLRTGGCSQRHVCVPKPNPQFSFGWV